jgi:hypothetical protein
MDGADVAIVKSGKVLTQTARSERGVGAMTRYAVTILLALTMPASAADMASANYFLPGCKAWIDKNTLNPNEATTASPHRMSKSVLRNCVQSAFERRLGHFGVSSLTQAAERAILECAVFSKQ